MKFIEKCLCLMALLVCIMLIGCNKVNFKVDFYVDGELYQSITTNGSEEIKMPSDPVKDGYIFDGWYWDEGTWLKPFSANSLLDTELKENLNVYAYMIDEDTPVGTDIKVKDGVFLPVEGVGDAQLVIVPNSQIVFSFSDYIEVGNKATWTVSTDLSGNNVIANKTVELKEGYNLFYVQVTDSESNKVKQHNLVIRRRPLYLVLFDTKGGSEVEAQYVEEDSCIEEVITTKKGYTFNGWNYDVNMTIKESTIFTANWKANEYNIILDPKGGTVSDTSITALYDSYVNLPIPTKNGYTFNGWYYGYTKYTSSEWKTDQDLTLEAKWTANTYNIEYSLEGGEISGYKPLSYTTGSVVTIPNPVKEGYEFTGWKINSSNDKIKDYDISDTTYGNLSLEATYTPNKYMITLDSNGGTCEKESLEVLYDNVYVLPTPTRIGYTFIGWYNGSTKVENEIWKRTASLDLIAKWEITNYTITYILNGGINSSNPSNYTVETPTILLQNPSKKGYTFLGWTTDDISEPVLNMEISNGSYGNLEVFANFKANTYSITYDVNGGEELEKSIVEIDYDEDYVLEEVVREGYTFKGWYNNSEIVTSGIWKYTTDITLVAKWEINTYYINYVLNGGVNDNSNVISYNYEYEDIVIKNPIKIGYTFLGWTTSELNNPTTNFIIPHNSTGNITLTANFEANTYNVTFDVNGGEELLVTNVNIRYNELFILDVPKRTGYEFKGWYNNSEIVTSGTWKYTTDMMLVAKWEIITYKVTYELNDSINDKDNVTTYTYESEDIVIKEPIKKGYTFIGWLINGSVVPTKELVIPHNSTGNITLTANFQINTYYITYDVNGGDFLNDDIISVVYNTSFVLDIPTRTGYTFKGWYNNSELVTSGVYSYTTDMMLVAKWEVTNYNIEYDLDGGTNNESNPVTYTYIDEDIVLLDPSKKGYTFIGWVTESNGEPAKNVVIKKNSLGDKSFTAIFEANIYKVTFDVNGGEKLESQTMEVAYDSSFVLPTPVNSVYKFMGWYSNDIKVEDGIWKNDYDMTLTAKWQHYYTENNQTYINLGRYPQTVVSDTSLIESLNNISKTNSLGYIEYNGEEYKKVIAEPIGYDFTFSDGSIIMLGEVYYFKVEPIKWKVLESNNGTYKLLSDMLLDCQQFYISSKNRTINSKTIYPNNYEYSNIRAWLNGYDGSSYNVDSYTNKGFIDIAFTEDERKLINTTLVDNSVLSTGYSPNYCICNNTNDKIYLISYKEVTNQSYGFTNSVDRTTTRMAQATDYVKAIGIDIRRIEGSSGWWLRSPHDYYSYSTRSVGAYGEFVNGNAYEYPKGVRAALEITIE